MRRSLIAIFLVFFVCALTACSNEVHYAPVTDINTIEHIPKSGHYRVAAGETLYSIAWRYGLDYRYLATLNHIPPPFHVVAGQKIFLSSRSFKSTAPTHYVQKDYEPRPSVLLWRWPAQGAVIGGFSSFNKGINIGGREGNPIYATAAGQIVYSGNGLRGYGNLIIIKHNNTYLSAYAHNSVSLVKEGQRVKAGQKIAEMGHTGAQHTMLHFEIRRNGQPVNPLNYLN